MRRFAPFLVAIALAVLAGLTHTDASTTPVPENLPRALEEQRRLVATQPGNAAAFNDLGNLLVLSGDLDAAEEAYRSAVELAPERAGYRYNLALLLQETDRRKEAAELYREVLEIRPDNAWAHYQLGAILEEMGRDSKAVDRYARAFRLDPSLAFPDVNPHVIDSHLLTESLLTGYREGLVTSRAPRVYNDPRRITRLLITDADGDGRIEPEEETGQPGMLAEDEEAEGVMAGEEPDDPMPAAERRVLDSDDLSDKPVNQASPQGRAGYRPPADQGGGGNVRTWRPPSQPDQGAEQPAQNPRRNRFRPQQGGVVIGNSGSAGDDEPRVGGATDPRRRLDEDGELPGSGSPNPLSSTGSLRMTLDDEDAERLG